VEPKKRSHMHSIEKIMDAYARDRGRSASSGSFSRDGLLDEDYPHASYDYSTDDHNNCEYQQGLWA